MAKYLYRPEQVALGQAAKYFQDMHGAFEAVSAAVEGRALSAGRVVLRQMAVGQPLGFHGATTHGR